METINGRQLFKTILKVHLEFASKVYSAENKQSGKGALKFSDVFDRVLASADVFRQGE